MAKAHAPGEYRFVFHNGSSDLSRKTLELERAEERSHAASISHARAGRPGGRTMKTRAKPQHSHRHLSALPIKDRRLLLLQKRDLAQPLSDFSPYAVPQYSPLYNDLAKDNNEQQSSRNLSLTKRGAKISAYGQLISHSETLSAQSAVTGYLDPFIRLPLELSKKDRNILHLYLSSTPISLYGTSARSSFCPVRDCTLPCVSVNQIFLQWILLLTETMARKLRNTDGDVSILARRATAYGHMKRILSEPQNWTLDSVIFGIVVAGIAEGRLGDSLLSQKHFNAALSMMNRRGGLRVVQDMSFPTGMIVLNAYVTMGGTQTFQTATKLRTASWALRRRLEIFQEWNSKLRTVYSNAMLESHHHVPRTAISTDTGNMRNISHVPGCPGYFGKSSALLPYVSSTFTDRHPDQLRSHLAILYTINSLLWRLQDCEDDAITILSNLIRQIELSRPTSSRDANKSMPPPPPPPRLTAIALLFILCNEASQLGHWHSGSSTALHSWETIEFVELLMLASPQTRTRVVTAMSSWLTATAATGAQHADHQVVLLDGIDFDALHDQIEFGWFLEHGSDVA